LFLSPAFLSPLFSLLFALSLQGSYFVQILTFLAFLFKEGFVLLLLLLLLGFFFGCLCFSL